MHRGSCLCGAVAYELRGELRDSVACHCHQCRKTSGHYWSATQVDSGELTLTKDAGLKWFRSSNKAQRGFCARCGSSLFWKLDGEPKISISTGTLDGATGIQTEKHIFMADKGDYYDIADGLPQLDKW